MNSTDFGRRILYGIVGFLVLILVFMIFFVVIPEQKKTDQAMQVRAKEALGFTEYFNWAKSHIGASTSIQGILKADTLTVCEQIDGEKHCELILDRGSGSYSSVSILVKTCGTNLTNCVRAHAAGNWDPKNELVLYDRSGKSARYGDTLSVTGTILKSTGLTSILVQSMTLK